MSIETVERPVAQEQTFNPPPYPRWFRPLHDVTWTAPSVCGVRSNPPKAILLIGGAL